MISDQDNSRSLIAVAAIGLAVATGLWLGIVQPLKSNVEQLKQDRCGLLAKLSSSAAAGEDIERWSKRMQRAAQSRAFIAALSEAAKTERKLIDRIGQLAERSSVRIEELRPEEISDPTSKPAPASASQAAARGDAPTPAATATPDTSKASEIRRAVRMAVTGSYATVTGFVRELSSPGQLAVIRSIRVVPGGSGGPGQVYAELTAELLSPNGAGSAGGTSLTKAGQPVSRVNPPGTSLELGTLAGVASGVAGGEAK